jgi:hypothetical protein
MGYPMTYWRVLWRNGLTGEYQHSTDVWGREDGRGPIRGDLRRLEQDQRDGHHLEKYAKRAGITPGQAKAVLDLLFDGEDYDVTNRRTVEGQRVTTEQIRAAEGA